MLKKFIIFLLFISGLLKINGQENPIAKAMNTDNAIVNDKDLSKLKNNAFLDNWSISLGYGITQFRGDIRQYNHYPAYNKADDFYEIKSAISFSLTKQINPFYSISGELISGKFAGLRRANEYLGYSVYDPWNNYEGNGDKFITSFKEADLLVNLEISKLTSFLLNTKYKKLKKISFISKFGVGYNIFNTERRNLFSNTYIHDFGYTTTEDYESLGSKKESFLNQIKETVYIYGLKAKYQFNNKSTFWLDYTMRNGKTDKWDGSIMKTQNIRDQYAFLSIGISYKIGKQNNTKDWISPIEGIQKDVKSLSAQIEGFTYDSDSDGVSDAFDKSPNTPIGVSVDGSGTPLDIDMDNIPDYRDGDPFSNRGAEVNENGIELDDDKDGVPNSKDLEVNTLIGSVVNQFGIKINSIDSKTNINIYLPSIFFNSGSIEVDKSNTKRLAIIAVILKKNINIKLKVIGHTDKVGKSENNKQLGMGRALSVIKYLKNNYNISNDRLIADTKGEDDPLLISNTKDNNLEINIKDNIYFEINRRVDFELISN